MISDRVSGRVYRCPICGAELSLIRFGSGNLDPICCNKKMEILKRKNIIFYCPVCGSELMLIRDSGVRPEPVCCNRKMILDGGD